MNAGINAGIEELVLQFADGTKSVSRIAREIKQFNGTEVPHKTIADITNRHGIPTPNRIRLELKPVYQVREYAIWVTHDKGGSAPYSGPRSEQIATIAATTAREALYLWQEQTYQENPDDPNLLLLPAQVPPLKGVRMSRARNTRSRVDAVLNSGWTPANLQPGIGITTDFTETAEITYWIQTMPDGSERRLTEDERAIVFSEWQVPNEQSLIQSQAHFWKQYRRIWGDREAAGLQSWIVEHDSEREWGWFASQQGKLTDALHARSAFVSSLPLGWNLESIDKSDLEARGLALRFSWQQFREFCLQGYEREFRLHPEPQAGKDNPLPSKVAGLSEDAFLELSAAQWTKLRRKGNSRQLKLIAGRLASSATISPAYVSSAKNPFVNIALTAFWEGNIPAPVMQFAQADWKKARDLTVGAALLEL